ncbi:hypothetical protein CALVIDRAFT_282021 [Calocera viscosa TUFC12733]|uniref:Uncharacterized protein n=1 Tax=Calocera viscosa (strain TUFC12733) TaxID=1330018 RepID=A0A167R6R9_CALVF|nr:hypothetical protein CALVIDRAFT_282021 [Calocera viscosa TUFC12733]
MSLRLIHNPCQHHPRQVTLSTAGAFPCPGRVPRPTLLPPIPPFTSSPLGRAPPSFTSISPLTSHPHPPSNFNPPSPSFPFPPAPCPPLFLHPLTAQLPTHSAGRTHARPSTSNQPHRTPRALARRGSHNTHGGNTKGQKNRSTAGPSPWRTASQTRHSPAPPRTYLARSRAPLPPNTTPRLTLASRASA